VAGACLLLTIGVVIALLSQTALWDRGAHDGAKPDGLTTLALVLAVISFFIQIAVFVLQTRTASEQVAQSHQLASETSAVLTKIEATSQATQEVLFSQFDRLLDYVVAAPASPGSAAQPPEELVEGDQIVGQVTDEPDSKPDAPVTRGDIERLVTELGNRPRPAFSAREAASSPDSDLQSYLKTFPTRSEAEDAVALISQLSPLAVTFLTRVASGEADKGERVRIAQPSRQTDAGRSATQELESRGLITFSDPTLEGSGRLTEKGRSTARVLPIGKQGDRPDWWSDVLTPLAQRPSS
jgi:hypothetical protein